RPLSAYALLRSSDLSARPARFRKASRDYSVRQHFLGRLLFDKGRLLSLNLSAHLARFDSARPAYSARQRFLDQPLFEGLLLAGSQLSTQWVSAIPTRLPSIR